MGPIEVIIPLLAPRLGLGGDFLGVRIPRSDDYLFRRMVIFPVSLPFGWTLRDGLGDWRGRPFLSFSLSLFFLFTGSSRLHLLFSCIHFYKRQLTCIIKVDDKNKTNEDDIKSTYDDDSIRPIYELQASIPCPRNTNEECQRWLSPYTFIAQMECQGPDEWIPLAQQLYEDEY